MVVVRVFRSRARRLRGESQLELVDTMPKERNLCFEAEFSFGASLDPWRTCGSLDDGIKRDETLWTVRPIDQS
ncbi:MAG TPA: hypothetical protein VLD86_04515 [Ilumatobacteraceae bacterium]|nr:hypothetical protein [Ilumatobacteraceae bacterium]